MYPLLLVLAVAAAIAVGPLGAGKKEQKVVTQTPTVAVVSALSVSQRTELTKLSAELRRSRVPEDRRLGDEIGAVLRAVPGAVAAVASFSHAGSSIAEKAIGLILGAVEGAGVSASVGATFNVDNSRVDNSRVDNSRVNNSRVAGPDFMFGGASNGAPIQANPDCVAYLVELDQLVDDDRNAASRLPGRSFPLDAGAKACGFTAPLGDASEIVKQLAKR